MTRVITDKQRLDWLSNKERGTISFSNQMESGVYVWDWEGKYFPTGKFYSTIRCAIDAAIKAERKK